MNFEDRDLAKRLLKGEEQAFNEFFNTYFARVYRFAMMRMRDDDAARDIVQQTLCRALRKIEGYRGDAALLTWLCQICRSQMSDYYAYKGRQAERFVPLEDDPQIQAALDAMAAPGTDPEFIARRSEVARLVRVVLDRLPPRYGDVLEWKYVDGISVEEIAARMGLQHGAAQSLLQRARPAFRAMFEQLYGGSTTLRLFEEPT